MSHPILTMLVRNKIRDDLRRKGHGLVDAIRASRELVTDDVVSTAVENASPEVQAEVGKVGAIGDGTILKFLTDFLNSELGKILLALIKSLIGV